MTREEQQMEKLLLKLHINNTGQIPSSPCAFREATRYIGGCSGTGRHDPASPASGCAPRFHLDWWSQREKATLN